VLRTTSTSDVLDSSLAAVRKARSKSSGVVDLALYRAAKSFIEEIVIIENDAGKEMNATDSALTRLDSGGIDQLESLIKRSGPKTAGTNQLETQKFKRFLHELVLVTLGAASDTDAESLRSARIHLGLTLSVTKVLSSETRETLQKAFTAWLEHERSRPLRLLVEQALQANSIAMSM